MKTVIFIPLIRAALVIILFNCCTKNGVTRGTTNCDEISTLKITGAKVTYYAGDTISLATSTSPYATYSWRHNDSSLNGLTNQPAVFIRSCTKYDEGWYYVTVSDATCTSHTDSVYVQVVNTPAICPCGPANNTVSFSAIPDINLASASWIFNHEWDCKALQGFKAVNYPDIKIYFNPYWNAKKLEDGAYTTTSSMNFTGSNVYTVFIATAYSGVSFQANPANIYISHVAGKLQVSFCSIPMQGTIEGSSYLMTATGKLTAP